MWATLAVVSELAIDISCQMSKALEELLAEPMPAAKEREAITFEKVVAGRPLVLFGAGRLGKRTLAGARAVGLKPLAVCDNNSALWGCDVEGLPVLSLPQAAAKFAKTAAFVITIWGGNPTDRMVDRERQLREAGCRTVLHFGLLYWRYPALFPHHAANSAHLLLQQTEQVRACAELWADDASRREYLAQVRWRLHFDFAGLPDPVAGPIYFRDELRQPLSDEVFVDCGAYDGDTGRSFLEHTAGQFKRIFAFEPDPANFAKLQATAGGDPRVSVAQAAVGRTNGAIPFSAEGSPSSSSAKGGMPVECVALDSHLVNERPTLIKMDIEGFEPEALAGAREIIQRDAPALAICVYHAQDHLWKIPLQIYSYNPNYKFYLKPHVYDVWDLVCYAIPHQQVRPPSTTKVAPVI
jgi:FkbM family methyltransferase